MPQDLLRTKLYLPSGRSHLVARPRLVARLNEGLTRPLTLLSAPAGFGKTTLLSEWIAQDKLPVGWLVLDADDNDPVRFWSYFIAALQQINAAIGSSSLALLQFPRDNTLEIMLRTLVNEIDSLRDDPVKELFPSEIEGRRLGCILVLDD